MLGINLQYSFHCTVTVNNEDTMEVNQQEDQTISTENLIDRSVKITFPKGQPHLVPDESEIQEKVSQYGEVVNVRTVTSNHSCHLSGSSYVVCLEL
jgi:hypothetical protein